MQCHAIILGTTGTTYTFYEIQKRKETIKEKQKQRRQIERENEKNKKKGTRRNNLSCPPPAGEVANTLKRTSGEKRKRKRNTAACKQSKTKNQGKNDKRKIPGRPKPKARALQVAASVCDTRINSIARFSLLIRQVPFYPGCRLRPAFVNNAPALGISQYEMSGAGSSSNHASRLLQSCNTAY